MSLTACFGSGATAVVMQPGGCTNTLTCGCQGSDAGPITEVLLTNGGSCYAVFGREEPTVIALPPNDGGTGAELEVTLTEGTDSCGRPAWSVTKVDVIEPGAGYSLSPVLFAVVLPGFESDTAVAEVTELTPSEPTLFTLVSASGIGANAVFAVSVTQGGTDPDRWEIASVSVTAGGSGYFDGDFLVVEVAYPLVQEVAAVLLVRTVRNAPTLDAFPFSGGSDATFSISVVDSGNDPTTFSAGTITVTSPGSGYVNGDTFQIFPTTGVTDSPGFATATVNDSGGLVSLSVTDGGEFYIDTGVVESVEVQSGGSYYNGDGIVQVTITFGGEYYLENRELPAIPAEVTVTPCGGGSGASITATVDVDVDSDTFAQVIALAIVDGGDNYLSWTYAPGCLDRINGQSLVLRASDPHKLVNIEVESCFGSGVCVEVNTQLGRCGDAGSPIPQVGFRRVEPKLRLLSGNQTAKLTPSFTENVDACGFAFWSIASVAISGGTGYGSTTGVTILIDAGHAEQNASLTLNATGGVPTSVTVTTAGKYYQECEWDGTPTPLPGITLTAGGSGYARLGRIIPTLAISASPGSNATFTPTLETKEDDCGLDYWFIDTVATKGGTGYNDSSAVKISVTAGVQEQPASLTLATKDGVPTAVTVLNGGKFYRESTKVAPYVATLTATVQQIPPSVGSGAEITLGVNATPGNFSFGKVTSATLTKRGEGYAILGGPKNCQYSGPCETTLAFSGRSTAGLLTGVFNESSPQPDCDELSFTSTIQRGLDAGSVSVTAGGLWDSCDDTDCGECPDNCPGVVTVTVEVCGETVEFTMPISGFGGAQITLEVPVAVPPEPQQGSGYIQISASSGCQSDGCGYEVGVLICYSCRRALETDPVPGFGEAFGGCIEADAETSCPVAGAVTMVCFGTLLDPPEACNATVTVVVS